MCIDLSPKQPDTSYQTAEAARQSQIEEQRYRELLAQQQAEWERQRADAERRYQEQYALQKAEIDRQIALQTSQQQAAERLRQEQIERERAAAGRGQQFADFRDQALRGAVDDINAAYGGFDENYFKSFADQFVTGNRGDLDRKHVRGKRDMRFKLADNRNLNSTAAADVFAEMDIDHASAISKLATQGSERAAALRNQIGAQREGAVNSVLNLGNLTVPDFQDDAGVAAARTRLTDQLAQLSRTLRQPQGAF